jgi:hypothetical protein
MLRQILDKIVDRPVWATNKLQTFDIRVLAKIQTENNKRYMLSAEDPYPLDPVPISEIQTRKGSLRWPPLRG